MKRLTLACGGGLLFFGTAGAADVAEHHGLNPKDMDASARPCGDFLEYAGGGWLKDNPIPAAYPSWGTFNEIAERNREGMRKVLEQSAQDRMAPRGSDVQKLGDFYAACMDEAQIEAQGVTPLQPELDRIAKISSPGELRAEIARLQMSGINAPFNFGSEEDRKDSTRVIAAAFQGGLGMPDRDYYLNADDKSKTLRDQYQQHVTKMLEFSGEGLGKAAEDAKLIVLLETKLADASMTRVERRDPEATYHKMTPADAEKLTPNFSWAAYFRDVDLKPAPDLNVGQPKFFEALNRLIQSEPLTTWRAYLRWHLIHAAAPGLSSKIVDENFDFFSKKLQGTLELLPRWKRCVQATDNALGFSLGKLYVAQYFPPESKKRADELVRNLIQALGEDIPKLPWMSDATKKAALEKLHAFTPKIGYPDKWPDDSTVVVDRTSHARNVQAAAIAANQRDLAKVGKPVDRTDWGMTPPTVNAYYNALKNEIVFPAGILQPPFFDGKADDAVNYGGIGAVIGHEMTHGFDDQGRKFDAAGNLKDWWTPEDAKNYEVRSKCVETQFSGYEVEPGLHENGKLVLGESIADLGGLTIAYKAFEQSLTGKPKPGLIDGMTPEQRFFANWARVWSANDRPEFVRMMTKINPHPLDRFRAIGAPSNMVEFSDAFGCKPGDPMVRTERCRIW